MGFLVLRSWPLVLSLNGLSSLVLADSCLKFRFSFTQDSYKSFLLRHGSFSYVIHALDVVNNDCESLIKITAWRNDYRWRTALFHEGGQKDVLLWKTNIKKNVFFFKYGNIIGLATKAW